MTVYRWALVLGVIANSRVEYRGKLDAQEILESYQPGPEAPVARDYQRLSSAEGVMTKPAATAGEVAAWAVGELAPWVLAVVSLVLLWPIVRRAERDDPFRDGAVRRLVIVGQLLLVGIPLIAVLQDLIAEVFTSGTALSPLVTPSITLSVWHFLPGVAVPVLAGVFKRGAELRDYEQHAI